jgi:hypothetical protein
VRHTHHWPGQIMRHRRWGGVRELIEDGTAMENHGDPEVQAITGMWGLRANAPGALQRTAELIPNQLRFSAPATLHNMRLA